MHSLTSRKCTLPRPVGQPYVVITELDLLYSCSVQNTSTFNYNPNDGPSVASVQNLQVG